MPHVSLVPPIGRACGRKERQGQMNTLALAKTNMIGEWQRNFALIVEAQVIGQRAAPPHEQFGGIMHPNPQDSAPST